MSGIWEKISTVFVITVYIQSIHCFFKSDSGSLYKHIIFKAHVIYFFLNPTSSLLFF